MQLKSLTIGIGLLLVALTPFGAAHSGAELPGNHKLVIGWQHEPPVVNEPNAVWIKLTRPAPAFGSELFDPDATYQYTFLAEGTNPYHCHPHPWMMGNITVVAAPHGHTPTTHHVKILDGANATDSRYEPANLEIKVGDTVHWMNMGTMAHTVSPGMGGATGSTSGGHAHGDHAHGSHDHGASDAAAHAPMVPVTGAEATLKVELTIDGDTTTLDFAPAHGEEGVYLARLIPTKAGQYTARLVGTLDNHAVAHVAALQSLKARADLEFPAADPGPDHATAIQLLRTQLDAQASEIQALKAQQQQESERIVPVDEQAPTPGPALVLVLAGLVGVALAFRRRRG